MPQTYRLAHTARSKFLREVTQVDLNLRLLVGHANLYDALLEELEYKERVRSSLAGCYTPPTSVTVAKEDDSHLPNSLPIDDDPDDDDDSDGDFSDTDTETEEYWWEAPDSKSPLPLDISESDEEEESYVDYDGKIVCEGVEFRLRTPGAKGELSDAVALTTILVRELTEEDLDLILEDDEGGVMKL